MGDRQSGYLKVIGVADLTIFGSACPPAGTELCLIGDLHSFDENRASIGLSFRKDRNSFHIIIVRQNQCYRAYVDRCPHAFARLGEKIGHVWNPCPAFGPPHIHCEIHGALFRFEDGHCISGPCQGRTLTPVPISIEGHRILLG